MEIRTKLQGVFRAVFDEDSIELFDEMTAKDLEQWDSLNHIILIVAVEKEFKVKFKTAEVGELKNVGEFIKLLEKKLEYRQ